MNPSSLISASRLTSVLIILIVISIDRLRTHIEFVRIAINSQSFWLECIDSIGRASRCVWDESMFGGKGGSRMNGPTIPRMGPALVVGSGSHTTHTAHDKAADVLISALGRNNRCRNRLIDHKGQRVDPLTDPSFALSVHERHCGSPLGIRTYIFCHCQICAHRCLG